MVRSPRRQTDSASHAACKCSSSRALLSRCRSPHSQRPVRSPVCSVSHRRSATGRLTEGLKLSSGGTTSAPSRSAGASARSKVASFGIADSLATLSRIRLQERNEAECIRLRRESVELRRRLYAQASRDDGAVYELGGGLSTLCGGLIEFNRFAEAIEACVESTRILDRTSPDGPAQLRARNQENVGRAYAGMGRLRALLGKTELA